MFCARDPALTGGTCRANATSSCAAATRSQAVSSGEVRAGGCRGPDAVVEQQAEAMRWLSRRCHNLQLEVLRMTVARERCSTVLANRIPKIKPHEQGSRMDKRVCTAILWGMLGDGLYEDLSSSQRCPEIAE